MGDESKVFAKVMGDILASEAGINCKSVKLCTLLRDRFWPLNILVKIKSSFPIWI